MLVFFETARLATVEHYENTVSSDYYDVPEPSTSLLVLIPGVSQYRRGNRRLGLVTGTAFAALSVASVSLWGAMRSYDTDAEKQGVQVFTNADLETAQRLLVLTELTRAGAAGVWVTSIVQELSIRPRVTLADEQLFTSVFVTGSW
jgi:hypothetical protein